jgi:Rod binding domain-containing protein
MEPISPITTSVPGLMGAGAPATPHGEGKQLEEACSDFIGLLYSYMFGQMRASSNTGEEADEGSLFGGEHAQMLLGFLDQEMGKKMAKAEGTSLAKQLFWQMSQGMKPIQGKASS